MKIIKAILPLSFIVGTITSCTRSPSSIQTSPAQVMKTAAALDQTVISETQATFYLTTPTVPPTTIPSTKPEITPTLSIDEQESFWGNLSTMPPNISITEYDLLPERNPDAYEGLFQFVPTQAWPVGKADTSPTPHTTSIKELGYELNNMQLYRDGRILFDLVTHVSDIYTFSTDSGLITAFIVEIDLGRENYLIQNDLISRLGDYAIYTSAPVLYQGELLWTRMYSDRLEVKKSNGKIIYTLTSPWDDNHYPMFRTWNGHWILEVDNFVVQDGEILNQKLGFEEMFDWGLVKDQPVYFFRRGSSFGISYDGQVLPLQYEDVRHGLCCGPAVDNPAIDSNSIRFFGKRNDIWYYVVMNFK